MKTTMIISTTILALVAVTEASGVLGGGDAKGGDSKGGKGGNSHSKGGKGQASSVTTFDNVNFGPGDSISFGQSVSGGDATSGPGGAGGHSGNGGANSGKAGKGGSLAIHRRRTRSIHDHNVAKALYAREPIPDPYAYPDAYAYPNPYAYPDPFAYPITEPNSEAMEYHRHFARDAHPEAFERRDIYAREAYPEAHPEAFERFALYIRDAYPEPDAEAHHIDTIKCYPDTGCEGKLPDVKSGKKVSFKVIEYSKRYTHLANRF